jgi:hypothetical protein
MRTLHLRLTLIAILSGLPTLAAFGADFGSPKEIKRVRMVVATKFGKALHASVSHDWALCTAYSDNSDLSVVLHRTGSGWSVVQYDGGAYVEETLKPIGVPPADIPLLLKAYQ